MQITIYPAEGASQSALNVEIQRAMKTLRAANISLNGGGIVTRDETSVGVILLREQADHQRALEVLTEAGIKAS
jgi:hypothetical protein